MRAITPSDVQGHLNKFVSKEVYFHLETSTGSYTSLKEPGKVATCAYVRNGKLTVDEATITGQGPTYQVGLKIEDGWLYSEGLTDWELTDDGKLLLGGHDRDGNLNIALGLSFHAFECGI